MNDEVAVTELMDREEWPEAPLTTRSRFRVVAVMVAVVLGCGLAALLVHIGAEEQRAGGTSPAVFSMPHGPSGGLAGGGVPASPEETAVTGTSTSITVTNEPPPAGTFGLPWSEHLHHQQPSTVTVTESPAGRGTTAGAAPPPATGGGTGGHGGNGGDGGGSAPDNPPGSDNPAPTQKCVLNITLVCIPLH